jgi:hypothetical protein
MHLLCCFFICCSFLLQLIFSVFSFLFSVSLAAAADEAAAAAFVFSSLFSLP